MPKYGHLAPALLLIVLLGVQGCGVVADDARPATPLADMPTSAPVPASAQSSPQPQPAATSLPLKDTPMPTQTGADGAPAPLSLDETTAQVQAMLAATLQIAPDAIQVMSAQSRIWPDRGLGCGARPGQFEPERTPGYEIIVSYSDTSYIYHSDEFGRLVRCPDRKRPIGPIS